MRVHLLSRPRRPEAWLPHVSLPALAAGLSAQGAHTVLDVAPGAADFRDAVRSTGDEMRQAWRDDEPDIVHAVGYVAAAAAVHASGGRVPVVATFYQSGPWQGLEEWLARRVDGLLVLSAAEADRWRRTAPGGGRARPGRPGHVAVLPPATCLTSGGPLERPGRVVVTDATGERLEGLVAALPASHRLVAVGPVSAAALADASARAERLGRLEQIEWRPSLAGPALARQVAEADVVVAVESVRHGGLVSQAAVAQTPAVAVAGDVHSDLVVHGSTGLLVAASSTPRTYAEAVRHLLADPLLLRGYGATARVRVETVQDPAAVGARALEAYRDVLAPAGGGEEAHEHPAALPGGEQERLVIEYLPLARQLASRYAGRGQPLEDLVQVASMGLVKAAQRFDPDHGTPFPSYAVPTIRGELRRHFRDHSWVVRVPRTLQEASLAVDKATAELTQAHSGRASVSDVAAEVGLTDLEVRQAQQTSEEAFSGASLDRPTLPDGSAVLGDLLGDEDGSLETVELRVAVSAALRRMPDREREILMLRFFADRTQAEIAEHLGMSQVHVSRTLSRTLAALRDHVLDEVPLPHRWQPAADAVA